MCIVNNTMKRDKTQWCSNRNPHLFTSGKWVMLKLKRTGHIEVCTGLRRSQDKRMAPSRVKSGRPQAGTLVTGETTARRDSVFSSTRMVTSMRACGPWTRSMDRVLTGEMRIASSGESIPVIGSRIKSMAEVLSSSRTAIDTMDTGSMECLKEREE